MGSGIFYPQPSELYIKGFLFEMFLIEVMPKLLDDEAFSEVVGGS